MRTLTAAALVALAATSCSTASSRRCADLTGLYTQGSCRQEEKKPLTDIRLPDDTLLAGIERFNVTQTGCSEVRIEASGRPDAIVLRPDEDDAVRWDEDGNLRGDTKPRSSAIMAGFARSSREWSLTTENGGLRYSDAHDERGMALVLLPFHDRVAASCEWLRVVLPASTAPAKR
jgi:hypothetical protein